jgi:hypothetical protein
MLRLSGGQVESLSDEVLPVQAQAFSVNAGEGVWCQQIGDTCVRT